MNAGSGKPSTTYSTPVSKNLRWVVWIAVPQGWAWWWHRLF